MHIRVCTIIFVTHGLCIVLYFILFFNLHVSLAVTEEFNVDFEIGHLEWQRIGVACGCSREQS